MKKEIKRLVKQLFATMFRMLILAILLWFFMRRDFGWEFDKCITISCIFHILSGFHTANEILIFKTPVNEKKDEQI
jgi:hypothetical protein